MSDASQLDGFDPLASTEEVEGVPGDPNKPVVLNILNSYTGFYDVFSELIQNSLDATQLKAKTAGGAYKPKIWVTIDMQNRVVRVTDNGVGLSMDEFKYCLRPNITFKRGSGLRGNKGVGATYLAYGFSHIRIQSKKGIHTLSAVLTGGRRWAEDATGVVPRPTFKSTSFGVSELVNESSGASFEIILGDSPGERPRDLGWIGARNASQWMSVLRIKTPLGGVYLTTAKYQPQVSVSVVDPEGSLSEESTDNCEYYYPHDLPGKVQSIGDIKKALEKVSGDANTKFSRVPSEFKKLDCMYEVWDRDALLNEEGDFASALDESVDRQLVERHNIVVYAAFLSSAKQWSTFNDTVLHLRKGQRIMQGGLQLATDGMIQGDPVVIPLTSTIGYQNNAHVVVHFTNGNPDMGRKVFQPELKALAEKLAVRAVTIFKRYLQHRKPDAGPPTITAGKALHEWRKLQEAHAERKPLTLNYAGGSLSLASEPQQEQDVVALFHELLALRVIRGYKIYATSQNETYDSLYSVDYADDSELRFDKENQPFGVSDRIISQGETEPKVLEYKFDFDSLIDDFSQEVKSPEQIDLVVCWTVSPSYKDRFYFKSLLVGEEGSDRLYFGATHKAYSESSQDMRFEVLVLRDLLSYLMDPDKESARQRVIYEDD